eukprot:scaffold202711_cov32-Tisochrysis_lutea.AAC.5
MTPTDSRISHMATWEKNAERSQKMPSIPRLARGRHRRRPRRRHRTTYPQTESISSSTQPVRATSATAKTKNAVSELSREPSPAPSTAIAVRSP